MLYPWLEPVFKKITRAYWHRKMSHAFLLTGEQGLGISQLVETLAQFLVCVSPSPDGPCHHCRSCTLYLNDSHPDYCVLGKDEEGIGIDDIRELHSFLQKSSHQSGFKVVTLYQADQLSVYTANALLKNLEEPISQTVFLLVGRMFQNVMPTIRSRCLPVQILPPSIDISVSWLKNKYPTEAIEVLNAALISSHHRPLSAATLLEETQEETGYFALKEALFWSDTLQFNQPTFSSKLNAQTKETLYLFYYWVAEYCRYGLTRNAVYLSALRERERYDRLLDVVPVERAFTFLDKIIEAVESLNITGINKELLWGSLVHQWHQLQKRDPIK